MPPFSWRDLRPSLTAGATAGLLAGLTLGLLILAFVEPIIRQAETYEPPSTEPPVVTDAQRDAGTLVGSMLFGLIAGVLLAIGSRLLRPLYPPWRTREWGLFVGLVAFLIQVLIPSLYHPALPPAVEAFPAGYDSVEAGTPVRQAGYTAVIVAGAAAFLVASLVFHRFTALRPRRPAVGALAAAASFLGIALLPLLFLAPIVYESSVPDRLIREYQLASASVRLLFWLILGWLFALMLGRWEPTPRARRAAA